VNKNENDAEKRIMMYDDLKKKINVQYMNLDDRIRCKADKLGGFSLEL